MCWTPAPKSSSMKRAATGSARDWLALRREAHRAVGGLQHLALDEAGGVDDVDLRRRLEVEDRAVEQPPGRQLLEGDRLGDVVDGGEPGATVVSSSTGSNSTSQTRPRSVRRVEEVEQRAADAADRGDGELARPDGAAMDGREQRLGAGELGARVADPQAEGGDRGAVGDVVGVGEALCSMLRIEVDLALGIALDVLGAVPAGVGEAHGAEERRELVGVRLVDGELDEGGALERGLRRQRRGRRGQSRSWRSASARRRRRCAGSRPCGSGR